MLVLTRRREEKIVIGEDIEIMVLHVGHDEVRLGVKAPFEVPVHRGELYEQIAAQNQAAVTTRAPAKEILAVLRNEGEAKRKRGGKKKGD